jgi:L-lactate dehydrogenase (cytochrome)
MRSAATCPAWSLATLKSGLPQFENLLPYLPTGSTLEQTTTFLTQLIEGHVTPEKLAWIRENWEGKLIVKGILDPVDARTCMQAGADGLVVSNHGGRQLDGCRSAPEALPLIRDAVGEDTPLLADGGVRNGLDIARMIAAGADFVLLGRPFMYAVAAMGEQGAAHVMDILKTEFLIAMRQIGCPDVSRLPQFSIR